MNNGGSSFSSGTPPPPLEAVFEGVLINGVSVVFMAFDFPDSSQLLDALSCSSDDISIISDGGRS